MGSEGVVSDGEDRAVSDATGQCACGLGGLVTMLVRKVDELVGTVRFLRDDNTAIRGELRELSIQLSGLTLAAPDAIDSSETTESRRTYVKVARSAVSSSAHRPHSKDQVVAPSSTGHRQNAAGHPTPAAPSSGATEQAEPLDQPGDGYRLVSYRKRRPPPGMGARKDAPVSSVPRPPAKRALFVSRLRPSTTLEELSELLSSTLEVGSFTCKKLRSKYDTYASFHISTTVDNFSRINDACVWPEGCLFRPFWGPLFDSASSETADNAP